MAHPGLVATALTAFDAVMKTSNQLIESVRMFKITPADILEFGPEEPITEQGLRTNISVGVQYLESWLRSDLQPYGRRRYGGNLFAKNFATL